MQDQVDGLNVLDDSDGLLEALEDVNDFYADLLTAVANKEFEGEDGVDEVVDGSIRSRTGSMRQRRRSALVSVRHSGSRGSGFGELARSLT